MTEQIHPTMEPSPTAAHDVPLAPTVPVVTGASPQRRGRLRWAAAITVVALVLGASVAVAALITGRPSEASVLGYVPDSTIVYGEVRLDLPGDQRRAVGAFLSKFPGFADQAALDSKLDEILDDLVKDASKGDQSYTTNIKPWFDGELALSVGPLPAASSLRDQKSAMADVRALALMSVKDPAAAQTWFDAAIKKSGATSTTETYAGTTLTVFAETDGVKAAFAVVNGKVGVLGDLVSVKAAVDTKGTSGFAAEPGPKAAFDAADADHVGFVYVGLRPLVDRLTDLGKAVSPEAGNAAGAALSGPMLKVLPAWTAYWLRFETDALVMEAAAPKPETAIGPTENRASAVVDHIPATAIIASTSNDFGKSLKGMLDLYRSDASSKPILDQLDQGLGLVGGADAALGWAGDTAIVVDDAKGTPQGGLIVVPTDKAAAERVFTALRTLITLGGGTQGVTVRDESHNGTTITIVDLGKVSDRVGAAGGRATGMPLPAGNVEIAYAVTGDIVVIGSGPAFVKEVLDTTKATSLGSSEDYRKLVDRAGQGTGTTFVDISAIRQMAEKVAKGTADPAAFARYEKELKPFLIPFDALIASSSITSDLSHSAIYITVK